VSTSDGIHSTIPTLTEGEQSRFLVLERRLARQAKGSRRREATQLHLSRLRGRLRNRRKDWIEKTTTAWVRGYDLIAIVDLKIRNMVRAPAPAPDPEKDHIPTSRTTSPVVRIAPLDAGEG
jgi:transposase